MHPALWIPIIATTGFFLWVLSMSPVGKAFAERIRYPGGKARAGAGAGGNDEKLLAAVEGLQREVAELAERVDFTERLLSDVRKQGKLPPRGVAS